jgi:GTPase SAR1 family protein
VDDNSKTPEQLTTVDFQSKRLNLHDKHINLSIWDTAGQERFRSVIANYFKSCHGVFFVFDLGKKDSWNNVQAIWYEMAATYSPEASFLLIGNKTDITPEISQEEI